MPSHHDQLKQPVQLRRPLEAEGEGNSIHAHSYRHTLLLAQEEHFHGGWLLQQPGGAIKRVVDGPFQAVES